MIVRRATAADAGALTDVIRAAYAPFQVLNLPPVAEGIADDIRDQCVWVAEVDGTVRGGIVASFGDRAHIMNLAVHPAAGGQRIGSALMAQAKQAAVAMGYDAMHLATHVKMTETQAFYINRGWSQTGHEGQKLYFQLELSSKKAKP